MKTPDSGASTEQALRLAQLEIRMLREQLAKVLDDAKGLRADLPKPLVSIPPKISSPPKDPEVAAPNGSTLASSGNGPRVLCVEDSEANFRLLEAILEDRPGTHLAWAETGGKGVEMAVSEKPQLVFLDLDLPDMHGSEVLKRLRAQPATAELPVVIISADATSKQIERMLAAGACDYLTKPFEVRRFLLLFDEFFKLK